MKKDITIDKEEIKAIANLLIEYSSKILSFIDQWNIQRRRIISLNLLAVLVTILSVIGALLLNAFSESNILVYFSIAMVFMILLIFLQLFRLEKGKLKSIEEGIYLLESKLEKLIRKASQIEEHVKIDKGMILELDLKLAEAEGSLRAIQQIRLGK